MDLDKRTYESIIKTETNVERILESLEKTDKKFEKIDKRFLKNDDEINERFLQIEKTQAILNGKFSAVWMLIGSAVTAVANLIFWFKKG